MQGTLVRTDGKVLTVTVSDPLLPGTAVRLDVEGGLVLGEVVGAETGATRCYLSVMIDQVIPSLSDLAALVQRVMDATPSEADRRESTPARVAVRRATAR